MSNAKEAEVLPDVEADQSSAVLEPDTDDAEEIDLSTPKSWEGQLSGAKFSASQQDGRLILSVTLEAEIPVCLNDDMVDLQTLDLHARVFDFALKVALDDGEIDDVDIVVNILGLIHVRDFLLTSFDCLIGEMQEMRHRLEPGRRNAERGEVYERSVTTLKRIADRINARLTATVDAGDLAMATGVQKSRLTH
jgi:hypothetical protein